MTFSPRLSFLFLSFFLVVAAFSSVFGQKITGSAKALAGKKIALYTYADFISYEEKKLVETEVSNTGSFTLETKLSQTLYCFLKAGNQYADFFVEPGKSYTVAWPDFSKTADEARPYFERDFRKLEIPDADSLSLNASIRRFNVYYDNFLTKNAGNLMLRGRSSDAIKNLRKAAYTQFGNITNPAFRAYVDYNLAIVEQITPVKKDYIYSAYLKTKPVRAFDLMYMDFFNQFFDKYLHQIVLSNKNAFLFKTLNAGNSWVSLDRQLQAFPYLENDTIRAMVLVKNLRSLYSISGIDKAAIKKLLKQMEREAPIDFVRTMAANVFSQMVSLTPGSKAPDFSLENAAGEQVSLDEFKGKYVYLEVTDPNCSACLAETKVIPMYKKKYGDRIRFVTVLLKSSQSRAKAFKEGNKLDWEILYAPSSSSFSEQYEITSVPQYFIIAPDGKFFRSPAEKPSHNAEKDFSDIKFKY
jgi:peroxiredoxin